MDKEKHMLTAILNTIDDGIYIIDQSYTVEYMNQKMIELFEDGVGKKCHQVLNNSDEICPWCRAEEIFKGQNLN